MAGLTLTGGIGHLIGAFGLTLDNFASAEIVTASGRVVTASQDRERSAVQRQPAGRLGGPGARPGGDRLGRDRSRPHLSAGGYLNYASEASTDAVAAAFDQEAWDRLRSIKAAWDPDNVFRFNHNIPPV